MSSAPLTFLFTDLEGSSSLWEQFPEQMRPALEQHDSLLRDAVENHDGRVIKTTGDGLHAVFDSPADGVAAALAGQLAIAAATWPSITGPLKVRMGLHTGISSARGGDFYGPEVNRAARIMSAGHGGQILLSAATCALVQGNLPEQATLQDLGEHLLRDLAQPEQIYQLCHPGLPAGFPPLKTLSAFKHNLPVQLTSFIGRERELAEIKRLLLEAAPGHPAARLVTLLGPGGTGKTRLSIQAAADLVDRFPDGVWLVELAPLTDPELLPNRVAAVFNLQEQRGSPILETLTNHLRHKHLLLLLDNVEHLVRESAELAEHLLMHCPQIRILVTGREALFIGGETTLQIPSLSLPKKAGVYEEAVSPDVIASSEAVQLFLARAQAIRPEFELTSENAQAVAELVRRLDGIPLALELAAARLRMMSVQQIAERLNDRFRLLTGGRRTALERQQTLQALIDWSWNLLDDHEQVLLSRLSVFSGGWTLEAAEEVAGIEPLDSFEVFEMLEQLINKSLVYVEHLSGGNVRYHLLESIRQYARDRLFESGEGSAMRHRHAEYFTAFGEKIEVLLEGPQMLDCLDSFLAELDNTKAAREWALDSRLDLAIRLVTMNFLVQRYWFFNPEGRRWLEALVAKARELAAQKQDLESQRGLAAAVNSYGAALFGSGESSRAVELLAEGVSLARETNAVETQVFGLNLMLLSAMQLGKYDQSEEMAEEALKVSEKYGLDFLRMMTVGSYTPMFAVQGRFEQAERFTAEAVRLAHKLNNAWATAMAQHLTGWLERGRRDYAAAEIAYLKAAELFDAVHDAPFRIISLSEAGHMRRLMGDYTGAENMYRQTIHFFQEGAGRSAVIHQLESFGITSAYLGRHTRAAILLGAANRLRETAESVRFQHEQEEFDQALAVAAGALSPTELEEAMARGAEMTIEDAVVFALQVDA